MPWQYITFLNFSLLICVCNLTGMLPNQTGPHSNEKWWGRGSVPPSRCSVKRLKLNRLGEVLLAAPKSCIHNINCSHQMKATGLKKKKNRSRRYLNRYMLYVLHLWLQCSIVYVYFGSIACTWTWPSYVCSMHFIVCYLLFYLLHVFHVSAFMSETNGFREMYTHLQKNLLWKWMHVLKCKNKKYHWALWHLTVPFESSQ